MNSREAFFDPLDELAQQAFLKRLARGILGDDQLAEDVVQDAWLAWFTRRERVDAKRAWLAQTGRHLSSNVRRAQARRDARERRAAPTERSDPCDDDLELAQFVLATLRALEEPLKTTLVLRYLHDLSPGEIAQRQRVPLDTVKSRLKRGLSALRAALTRRYGGVTQAGV